METEGSNANRPAGLRMVVMGAGGRANVLSEARRLRPTIEQFGKVVAEDFTGEVDLSRVEADVAIVFGGDGSILRAARQMAHRQLPVIAVNLGRLGFLADLMPEELPQVLEDFQRGRLQVAEHLMFECTVLRRGQPVIDAHLGLNEVVIHAGMPFTMLQVGLYVNAEQVTTYVCDGLIVSTPVGSTAYSLSSGGPILRKTLMAFVVLPISPHTLTNRPVVDAADRIYELEVLKPNAGTAVSVDGKVLCSLEAGDRVRVEQAEPRFKLVMAPGHSYYRTLREKLGWGGGFHLNPTEKP